MSVTARATIDVWRQALRVHQWLKNLLMFLPLLTAHLLLEPTALARTSVAFLAFSVCASSVYLLNDLLDLNADRQHPRKRLRPFAAGTLPLRHGWIAIPLLLLIAFGMALALSYWFCLALLAYYLMTLLYSFWIKPIVMLDVVILAALYTMRIIAGAAATVIPVSSWLLAFSMFLFFSLALLKRYTELLIVKNSGLDKNVDRGYTVNDLPLIQSLGSASGYLSVLVLALYINSTASEALYRHPQVLWLLCPLLLYWISRAWAIVHRGGMHEDPVIFAATDPTSYTVLGLAVLIIFGAI